MYKSVKKKNKFYKFISKRRSISLIHSSILRRIWLNFMAKYLVFSAFIQFSDFQLFEKVGNLGGGIENCIRAEKTPNTVP
jgi:hypothetical protein